MQFCMPFFFVRPAGRTAKEWKSPTSPVRGIVSLRARVSIAKLNLKEATGKTLD